MPLGGSKKIIDLELNGKHQDLVYADDVNMLGEYLPTIRENMEILITTSKDIGLEVNSEKIKYMTTSRDQNVIQYQNIIIRVFCPRAGPSLQAQEPRLQFCRRQVFHRRVKAKTGILPRIE